MIDRCYSCTIPLADDEAEQCDGCREDERTCRGCGIPLADGEIGRCTVCAEANTTKPNQPRTTR